MSQDVVGYESNADTRSRSAPRRRRRVVLLLALAVIATALFAAWSRLPVLNRDGGIWARIEVDVRDAGTGRPVPGATLTMLDHSGAAVPPNVSLATQTDTAGRASARVLAGFGSADYFIYERIGFATNDESVQVNAPGYTPATVRLPRRGSTWRIFGSGPNAMLRVRVDLSSAAAATPPG